MRKKYLLHYVLSVSLMMLLSRQLAAATLTPDAIAAGFKLDTFVSGIPVSGGAGPWGITNTINGNILISGFGDGTVRTFGDVNNQDWNTNAINVAGGYGAGYPAGLATLGDSFYMAEYRSGKVIQIDPYGNYVSDIVNKGSWGLIGNTYNNTLYSATGVGTFAIDPITHAASKFNNLSGTGLALSPDGKTLYQSNLGGHVYGYDIDTKTQIFDSGQIMWGWPDGIALGTGVLAGNLFVNTEVGRLIQVNLNTLVQTVIMNAGTRGSLVTADRNNGSLLLNSNEFGIAPHGAGRRRFF